MRYWAYLLFLFLYSSTLVEVSYRDSLSRNIASEESCLLTLKKFFPNQSTDFMVKRIANATDLHSFYRAFVPLFYKEILKAEKSKIPASLDKFKGLISGDSHVENFGLVRSNKKFSLRINDIDDSTIGEFYLDPIRHFTSAKIIKAEGVNWVDYLRAYASGVRDVERTYSNFVDDALKDGEKDFQNQWGKYIGENNGKLAFIKKKGIEQNLNTSELEAYKKFLAKELKLEKIHDLYLRIKEDGGSAGLMRFELLAESKKGELVWYDVKERDVASYDKALNGGQHGIDLPEKLRRIEKHFYNGVEIEIVTINGTQFTARKQNQFLLNNSFTDVPANELSGVIYDQAYVLGRAHRDSFITDELREEYLAHLESINPDDVETLAESLITRISKIYQELSKK